MDKRTDILVPLPHPRPTASYWQDPPSRIADLRSTDELPASADIVIIGSGISGAAVAWNLLEDGPRDIVMLEARQACSGASGRNGGHTKGASYREYLENAERHGTATAVRIAQLHLANIRGTHAFAAAHGVACDSHPCNTVDVIYDAAQWDQGRRAVHALRDAMPAGHPAAAYALHGAAEVRDRFLCGRGGDEGVQGGISYEAGSINAYRFGTGVLELCLERGLNLQTNTPAQGLEKLGDGRWKVRTSRGDIIAKKLVLATNGYTAHLLPQFRGVIVPLRGQVTAQRPGRNMPAAGLPTTYSFIYEGGFEYMIPRPRGSRFEGDIVIGGGLAKAPDGGASESGAADDGVLNEGVGRALHDCLPQFFGDNWGEDHPEGRIRQEWTGIMGYSPDGHPFVGQVPGEQNLWMSCCFQGHGMVLCWMSAKALAWMMGGKDREELLQWFPDVFLPTEERLDQSFQGLVYSSAEPKL